MTGLITSALPAHKSSKGAPSRHVKRYPLERRRARVGSHHDTELRLRIPKRARRMAVESGHRVLRVALRLTARTPDGATTTRKITVRVRVAGTV